MASRAHVVAIPHPSQGHINPMFQFCKRLALEGIKITFLLTSSASKSLQNQASGDIDFEVVLDGSESGERANSMEAYFTRLRTSISKSLAEILDKLKGSAEPPKALIYDHGMHWALDIAHERGMKGACFFTQSCSANAIYYHMHKGSLKIGPQEEEAAAITVGSMPIGAKYLPKFDYWNDALSLPIIKSFTDQFLNVEEMDWLIFNSFDKLESEVVDWMKSRWRVKTIGPAIPWMYENEQVKNGKDQRLHLFKPNTEDCMKWLDSREASSVIYVALGSVLSISKEQMEELAWGLLDSNCNFLLVVRESEESKLPEDFKSKASERGLVVNWCPQVDVLAHPAVTCFMTHCGWNSVLEALSLGVPMIAMPKFTDQTTNAKFVEDVWKCGVLVNEKNGIVTREEIVARIEEITQEDKWKEVKEIAIKWRDLAKEAVAEGGSSDKNIKDLVSEILLD